MSSIEINQTMAADIKTLMTKFENLETKIDLLSRAPAPSAEPSAEKPKGKKPSAKAEAKKAAKAAAEADGSAEPSQPRTPSAWNVLVAQTVADMRQNGWESWTDLKGAVWPASRRGPVKDKSGAQSEGFVYDGGENDGKAPSPALGGMVRASYFKTQADPAHAAVAQAYQAKLVEKRSVASASVGDGEKEAPVADAAAVQPKKAGRKPMTDEQKAEAKAKREAAKAEAAPAAPVAEKPAALKKKVVPAPAPAPKKLDLTFLPWSFNGMKYIKNDREDVIEPEEGVWVGRFNGKTIDESVPEPDDLDGVTMRE